MEATKENSTVTKEFPIKDNDGNVVLTIKLIEGKTRVFNDDKPLMLCITVPVEIPMENVGEFSEIESINDVLDAYGYDDEEAFPRGDLKITPELNFFVTCSNLQTWVENDYDTHLIDYRLVFPLLISLAESGNAHAEVRLKEEIARRYHSGYEGVREFLDGTGIAQMLTPEEHYAPLPLEIQVPMVQIRTRIGGKEIIKNGKVLKLSTYRDKYSDYYKKWLSLEDIRIIQEAVSKLQTLEELKLTLWDEQWDGIATLQGDFPHLHSLEISIPHLGNLFDDPARFPSLKKLLVGSRDETLTESIANLKHLTDLELYGIGALPESFGKLEKLECLEITRCPIEHLPESFGNLKNLKELRITECKLQELPESFSNLKKLKSLTIYKNQLDRFPLERLPLKSLEHINLSGNKIPYLSKEIENFHKIRRFYSTI